MKIMKLTFAAFVISSLLAISGVNATSYVSLISVNLPGWSGTYTSDTYSKTIVSPQYNKKVTAIDTLSGDERAVSVRTTSTNYGTSAWISSPKNTLVSWGEAYSNMYNSSYKLQLKLSTFLPTGAYYNGFWYLDNTMI